VINGKRLPADAGEALLDRFVFGGLLQEIHANPWEWEATEL
jgi:hypothetical protein